MKLTVYERHFADSIGARIFLAAGELFVQVVSG